MPGRRCVPCQLVLFTALGIICSLLFLISLNTNYQWEYVKEYVRFRRGFPTQRAWLKSPVGTLRVFMFNVTNAERFLNGSDARIKVEEVGPIVYRVWCHNEVLEKTETSLTFRRHYYDKIEFVPEASISPDILDQLITLPNLVLLSSAAKLYDWVFLVRHAFNAITINESVFLKKPANYFLWDFTLPTLSVLANYVPNIVSNCGILHNALKQKQDTYKVEIGPDSGIENFFRVKSFNNKTYFPQQRAMLRRAKKSNEYCPITVEGSFSNDLYAPMLTPQKELSIMAADSCRTFKLNYDGLDKAQGLTGYRYTLSDSNQNMGCLDYSMGIKLPKGIFDTSRCLKNDVPAAFSSPHFLDTGYNHTQHFEGFAPDKSKHETYMTIEPNFGIPLAVKYRFQLNIPMPDMKGFNKHLQRLSHLVIPSIWYEFDMDDMSTSDSYLLYFSVHIVPKLQPYIMAVLLALASISYLNIYLLFTNRRLSDFFSRANKTNNYV